MFERLAGLLSENMNIDPSHITMETHLHKDLGISSFDIISLVCAVEEEFQVCIPDRKIAAFLTVRDIVTFLEETA